jgi:hypothetical protein
LRRKTAAGLFLDFFTVQNRRKTRWNSGADSDFWVIFVEKTWFFEPKMWFLGVLGPKKGYFAIFWYEIGVFWASFIIKVSFFVRKKGIWDEKQTKNRQIIEFYM